jgi:LysM repeat protein
VGGFGLVTDPKYRIWVYRIAAPAAFFLAATILVILIEHGLNPSSSTTPTVASPTTSAPSTPTTVDTTPSKKKQIYRVKTGDTLESIAAKFNTTVDDLLALNPGIDPLALSPGQKIRVA